jgi:hypothetical protein
MAFQRCRMPKGMAKDWSGAEGAFASLSGCRAQR